LNFILGRWTRQIKIAAGETPMEQTRIVSQERVHGEVEYNDGEFAEIQAVGIEEAKENTRKPMAGATPVSSTTESVLPVSIKTS
jgi:hypothetical protein